MSKKKKKMSLRNQNNKKKKKKKKNTNKDGEDGVEEERDPTEAMILPVVSYDRGNIELIDLTTRSKLFEEMDALFVWHGCDWKVVVAFLLCCPCIVLYGLSTVSCAASEPPPPLKVHRVGSYEVSIVPSKEDFDLLDKEVFTLDPNVAKLFSS